MNIYEINCTFSQLNSNFECVLPTIIPYNEMNSHIVDLVCTPIENAMIGNDLFSKTQL